jgi:hypothetical protein
MPLFSLGGKIALKICQVVRRVLQMWMVRIYVGRNPQTPEAQILDTSRLLAFSEIFE